MAKKIDINKIADDAKKAADGWLLDADVATRVVRVLNSKIEEIAAQLLGFEKRWDRWEVDRCNGRDKTTAAGDYVRSAVDQGVKKWFDDLAGNLPGLPKKARASLISYYLERLERELRQRLERKAEDDAARMVNEIIEEAAGRISRQPAGGTEATGG